MRPSFELWGSSLPVTSGYTFFTQERELRFHLKLPHTAGNPEPAAATLSGHFSIVSRFCSSLTAIFRDQPKIHQ
jgi:hypothetical protein